MHDTELLKKSTERLCRLFSEADNEDLKLLVEYNMGPNMAEPRCEELIDRIRSHGSNDIMRLLRGEAVDYLTIVRDVADKVGVPWSRVEDEEVIETKIYLRVFERAWQGMSDKEREPIRKLFAEQGIDAGYVSELLVEGTLTGMMPIIGYLVTWNIVRIVAAALAREAGAEIAGGLIAEGLGVFLGPLGVVLGIVIAAADLAGPAYRKTIPTVLQIAYIRQKAKAEIGEK